MNQTTSKRREIKFRAWDRMKKKLSKPFLIQELGNGKMLYGDLELMQYTGLKDKNGEEIYEGDLVAMCESVMSDIGEDKPNYIEKTVDQKFKYADGTVGERRYGREVKLVEWKDSSCGFEPFSDSDENCGHCGGGIKSIDVEVVGNALENPELLTTNHND